MSKSYKKILFLFLVWRAVLLVLGYISSSVLPTNTYTLAHLQQKIHPLLNVWVKWDSVWFYEIIRSGYIREGLTAFFPLYPISVRVISKALFFVHPVLVGLGLSSIFLLGALFVFYKLLRLDYDEEFSHRAVFYLLIFPSALFYTLVYSEGLFLLLSISTFYFARVRRWKWCGILGFLAALTRPVGILLLISILLEFLISKRKDWGFGLSLLPLGLVSYMAYLNSKFSDPLLFLHVQKEWGRFSSDWVSNILNSLSPIKFLFFLSFALGSVIIYKKVRKSYGIYVFLNLLPCLISGSFMSINRHFAVLFPFYIILSHLGKNRPLDRSITLVSILFLAYTTILYVNGYWVG